jgi:hypothetical protein
MGTGGSLFGGKAAAAWSSPHISVWSRGQEWRSYISTPR